MKLLIFGNSGSGKSRLARALAQKHDLVHLDLDSIVWKPGQVAVRQADDAIAASLAVFPGEHGRWVIEGCYGELIEAAAAHCSKLIFLNPGLDACLTNNARRPWEPHKYASREAQDAMLGNLQAWVADCYARDDAWSYRRHRRIFDAYDGTKIEHTDLNAIA